MTIELLRVLDGEGAPSRAGEAEPLGWVEADWRRPDGTAARGRVVLLRQGD